MSRINYFVMAMRVSMTIHAASDHQIRQMTKTLGCALCCVKLSMNEYSKDILPCLRDAVRRSVRKNGDKAVDFLCRFYIVIMLQNDQSFQ